MPIKSFYRFEDHNQALLERAAKASKDLYQQELSVFLKFSGLLCQEDEFFAEDVAALAAHSSISLSEDKKDDSGTVFIVNRDELMAEHVETWLRFKEAAEPYHQKNLNVDAERFNRLVNIAKRL